MTDTTRRFLLWAVPGCTIVAALALWQVITSGELVRADQFPTMTDTFAAFGTAAAGGDLWAAAWSTLQGWFWGLLIASLLAIGIGSAMASSDFASRSAATVIEVFKAIPAIAILPLVILILGSTLNMKIFLIAFGVFWPLLIQVIYGVRSIDPVASDTAKALRIRGVRRFLMVTVPSASPYLMTGLRIGSATALILAVVSELVGGADGIGRRILQSQNGGTSAYPAMYAYIVLAGLLGILLTGAFFLLERKAMHWHESQRNARLNEKAGSR